MATPAFTGVDYLSALSEFPGGPQGLIDAAVERFGDQGLTATPRGDDFSLYVLVGRQTTLRFLPIRQ